jgi:adenosine deaminase
LNTDDPGVFDTDLTQEYTIASDMFGFDAEELAKVRANAERFRFRNGHV